MSPPPVRHLQGDDIRKGGSLFADMALWFMLACSFAAFTGVVSHRDVIHSHSICILWAILHHMSRRATAWRGTGYFHTLFAPSAALLPLEYCLNLIEQVRSTFHDLPLTFHWPPMTFH